MSNQPHGKKAHDKQLGPIAKSLDRGHRAALAVCITCLGSHGEVPFLTTSSSKQQAGGPKLDILDTPIA